VRPGLNAAQTDGPGSLGVLLSTFAAQALECDPVAALELQHGARLVRRGDFKAQPLDQGAHLRHLLRIAFRKLAGADPQRILHCRPLPRTWLR